MPMSSAAFILFTLYMIPDPATTPIAKGRQVLFGGGVALAYAVLQLLHIVFGLFLALAAVCTIRASILFLVSFRAGKVMAENSRHEAAGVATEVPADLVTAPRLTVRESQAEAEVREPTGAAT